MTNSSFCNVKHKSSVSNVEYSLCDLCTYNRYPHEIIVIEISGFPPEIGDGFVIKVVEYDFPIQNGRINVHNYEELIKTLVNQSLDRSRE
jgi:hypothetical protein